MEPRSFKKLAPAPAQTDGDQAPSPTSQPTPGPRKNLTRNACSPCKVKKAKCDGNRPACGRCSKSGDICLYEVNRRDIIKLQLLNDNDMARLQHFELIFGALQNGTNQQAAELLNRIRHGEPIDMLASTLNSSTAQPSSSASSLQTIAAANSSAATASDDLGSSSTATMTQGFLDLLFDRDDWLQPAETISPHDTQTPQGEMQSFAHDSARPSSAFHRTYDLLLSTDSTASHPQDGFSDNFDKPLSLNINQANQYPIDGTDSPNP